MKLTAAQSRLGFVLGMGLLAAVLYSSVVFLLAFVIPLFVVNSRHGFRSMLQASLMAVAAISVLLLLLGASAGQSLQLANSAIGLLPAVALTVGACLLASPIKILRAYVPRLLISGAASTLLAVPVLIRVLSSGELGQMLELVLGQTGGYLDLAALDTQAMTDLMEDALVKFYGVSFFIVLLIGSWFSTRLERTLFIRNWLRGGKPLESLLSGESADRLSALGTMPMLPRYQVPPQLVWLLLAAWSVLLGTRLFSVTSVIVGAVAWNTAVALSICYAIQGLAILFVRIMLTRLAPAAQVLLPILLLIIVVGGSLSLVVSAILALIGTLETWIPFRNPTQGDKT